MQEVSSSCEDCFYYPAKPTEQAALITFKDGSQRKIEFYYGQGFRAQAQRGLVIENISEISEVEILMTDGEKQVYVDMTTFQNL